MLKAAHAYLQTQVSTTTQGDLLLLLYDGAIKFLKQAKEKIREKNYAEKGLLISRAIDVISELDASLNPQKGGDLADNLHNLYFFCNTRLLKANLKMDIGLIDEVVKILTGLRGAFAQILNGEVGDAEATAAAQGASPQAVSMPRAAPQPAFSAAPRPAPQAPQAPEVEARPTGQVTSGPFATRPLGMPVAPAPSQAARAQAPQRPQGPQHSPAAAARAAMPAGRPVPGNPEDFAASGPAPGAAPRPHLASDPRRGADAAPEVQPAPSRKLAGANIYRKMATQT